jgi:hypothetical protein
MAMIVRAARGMGGMGDVADTAVDLANSSGVTALVSGITSIFGGKPSGGGSSTALARPTSSASAVSPWIYVGGAAAAVALFLALRK